MDELGPINLLGRAGFALAVDVSSVVAECLFS
jgi:hypothetical protein